jgi:hypothetical protein
MSNVCRLISDFRQCWRHGELEANLDIPHPPMKLTHPGPIRDQSNSNLRVITTKHQLHPGTQTNWLIIAWWQQVVLRPSLINYPNGTRYSPKFPLAPRYQYGGGPRCTPATTGLNTSYQESCGRYKNEDIKKMKKSVQSRKWENTVVEDNNDSIICRNIRCYTVSDPSSFMCYWYV